MADIHETDLNRIEPAVVSQSSHSPTFDTLAAALNWAGESSIPAPRRIFHVTGVGYQVEHEGPRQLSRWRIREIHRRKIYWEEKRARTDAVRSRVFAKKELFEMILVRVDPKTLLSCEGVCKGWKATIDDSKLLQLALPFNLALLDCRAALSSTAPAVAPYGSHPPDSKTHAVALKWTDKARVGHHVKHALPRQLDRYRLRENRRQKMRLEQKMARKSAARRTVFAKRELFETILAQVDPKTLLSCQEVSKYWKAATDRMSLLK